MKTNTIVWQPVPAISMRFAIESDAPAVLQRAQKLFAPWIVKDINAVVERSWRIETGRHDPEKYGVAQSGDDYLVGVDYKFNWHEQSLVELLTQIEYASLAHLVAHLPASFIGLHGALLSRGFDGVRRAVIITGPKEAGKSTLACALWRAGWMLHCDDFTLLDAHGYAHPTARRVSLRPGSRALMGDELWLSALQTPSARESSNGVLFHPHEIEGQDKARVEPLPIGAIFFLKRLDAEVSPAQALAVNGIEAALALLPASNLLLEAGTIQLSPDFANWGVQLGKIAALTADLSFYDLGRSNPAAMIREIEHLVS